MCLIPIHQSLIWLRRGFQDSPGSIPVCTVLTKVDKISRSPKQCWGRYFLKVTSYLLLVTSSESNSLQLHITSTQK